jgi:hypothetical protein
MAKAGKIEIQVELDGIEKSENQLEGLSDASGAVGESFSSMGDAVSSFGGEANEALGAVGGSVGGLVGSFQELGGAVKVGGLSFSNLAGPIGIAIVAVFELVQAFREYVNEVDGTTLKIEAYQAAAAELSSVLDEMAAAQIRLTNAQVKHLENLATSATATKEFAQKLRERQATTRGLIIEEEKRLKVARENLKQMKENDRALQGSAYLQIVANSQIAQSLQELSKLNARLEKEREQANKKAQEAFEKRKILEAEKKEILKTGPEFQAALAKQEFDILTEAKKQELNLEKGSLQALKELAVIEATKRQKAIQDTVDVSGEVKSKALIAEAKTLNAQLNKIERDFRDKRRADAKKRKTAKDARVKADLATERQLFLEVSRIKELEIQADLQGDEKLIKLSKHRLKIQQQLFKDSKNQIKIAQLQHDAEMQAINQAAIDREVERAKLAHELVASATEFDAQRITDQTDRQLALIDLRYEREFRAALGNENKITELQRQQTAERKDITDKAANDQIDKVGELTESYGAGFAQAAVGAIFFGESFKEATAQILEGLARQSAVQALVETAKGVAALFSPLPGLSASHFKAAGIFASAAALAGVTSSAMAGGGGGGGGGAGGGSVSPMGSQQGLSSAPIREEAEQGQQVFNINLSGAVIYDTKASAEQAFTDRITQIMNTPRRGMRRA